MCWRASVLVLAAAALLQGCGPNGEPPPEMLLGVTSEAPLETLELWAKLYRQDGRVHLLERSTLEIPSTRQGYLIGDEPPEPLRLRVELPEPGRYALHLVGRTRGGEAPTTLTATICGDVQGAGEALTLALGLLTDELDLDGDTFPEDLGRYCRARQDAGLPCETGCNDASFRALLDCNYSPDLPPELGEGCAEELPADDQVHPFAPDPCADCLDTDCYGGDALCEDEDGDGYPGDVDCNDNDPEVHPGAEERCGNGVDDNCAVDLEGCPEGDLPCDADGDSFLEQLAEGCGRDCDDSDPRVNPFAFEGCGADPLDPESCPGCTQPGGERVDDNCDGRVDEGCVPDDIDQDGVPAAQDCDDCNAAVGPGFLEFCGDGIDQDCSGEPGGGDLACPATDQDGDGFEALPDGSDCDDDDWRTFPEAPDRCGDGVAQNCSLDLDCASITDGDSDGFGLGPGDCDDGNAAINVWATEQCDPEGIDEDCDGVINELDTAGLGCGFDPNTERWYAINLLNEMDNCGACRHRCEVAPCIREGDDCVDGQCSCHGGPGCGRTATSFCCPADSDRPAGCRNLSAPQDCGECGYACRPGELCQADTSRCGLGRCFCVGEGGPCPEGPCWACCGEAGCVNLCTSPEHCGDCARSCVGGAEPRGDICWGENPGAASCYCATTGTRCTDTTWCTEVTTPSAPCGCANLLTDEANCGSCELTCDSSETCQDGLCRCGVGGPDCEGGSGAACCVGAGCVDLQADVDHCGSCSNACAYGESCVAGVCECGDAGLACDPATEDCCEGICQQVLIDPTHCGLVGTGRGCSRACALGVLCTEGNCPCSALGECGPGDACCDGTLCSDIASDPANCGACGAPCRVGEVCLGGSCRCDTCDDDDSCTEDSCEADRCVYRTLDADDDGYCEAGCLDAASGAPGDCTDGDCDDSDPFIHPNAAELCNSDNDDCDAATADGSGECGLLGAPPLCCGLPRACRACCDNSDCPGVNNICSGSVCQCAAGWESCAGTCDCDRSTSFCCAGVCTEGDCCSDSDCTEARNPNCDTSDPLQTECFCRDEGSRCNGSENCCAGVGCLRGECP